MSNQTGLFGDWVLCNDCLRVKPFSVERHNGEEPCDCGSYELCGCGGCNQAIEALRHGKRTDVAGIPDNVNLDDWTEKYGIKGDYYHE